jgi:hypothetical protein
MGIDESHIIPVGGFLLAAQSGVVTGALRKKP